MCYYLGMRLIGTKIIIIFPSLLLLTSSLFFVYAGPEVCGVRTDRGCAEEGCDLGKRACWVPPTTTGYGTIDCVVDLDCPQPNCDDVGESCCVRGTTSYCEGGLQCLNDGQCGHDENCIPIGRTGCAVSAYPCCADSRGVRKCFVNTCIGDDPTPGDGKNPSKEMVYSGPVISELEDILGPVTKILYYGGLAIGGFFIILAGYSLMTSEGDPQKTKAAQERLTAAVIGIIFILLSITILRVIMNEIVDGITI